MPGLIGYIGALADDLSAVATKVSAGAMCRSKKLFHQNSLIKANLKIMEGVLILLSL